MRCLLICHISRIINFSKLLWLLWLYYDYLTFGTKITICFLGDIRIQFKRINKKPWKILQLNHSHKGLWIAIDHSMPFQKNYFWERDSSLAAQIFMAWPRPYFNWHVSAVENWSQTCPLLFNDCNYEIKLIFWRNGIKWKMHFTHYTRKYETIVLNTP